MLNVLDHSSTIHPVMDRNSKALSDLSKVMGENKANFSSPFSARHVHRSTGEAIHFSSSASLSGKLLVVVQHEPIVGFSHIAVFDGRKALDFYVTAEARAYVAARINHQQR